MPYKKQVSLFIKIGRARESHKTIIRCLCCGDKVEVKTRNYKYCEKCCKKSKNN